MEPAWLALRHTLQRAPLLAPLAVTCGAIVGGVWGWAGAVAVLAIAVGLGMQRVVCCAVLCGMVAGFTQAVKRQREAELHALVAAHSAVAVQGVVVQQLAHGCVVQTPWPGLRVAVLGDMDWRVADCVQLVAEEQPPITAAVPGMFSTEKWMRGQGISARLTLLHGEVTGRSCGWWRLVRLAEVARAALAERLMPPGTQGDPRRQTLCALLLGDKSLAESDTMEIFRRGGCLHVFAVSGLHVGLLAGIISLLLRLLRVRPVVGRWALLVVVGAYVVITGLAAPALRAYLLLAALLFGLILRRRATLLNTWCFAALLLLLLRPSQLYQAGFQLSFAIYAAISLGVRYGMRCERWFGPDAYLPTRLHTRADRLLIAADSTVRGVALVSLCAWLAALPLSIAHFHVVNTVSYVTNIALTPLLPPVMCCGLLALCLGWLPIVGAAFHWLAVQSVGLLMWVVSATGAFPGAFLPAQPPAAPGDYLVVPMRYDQSFTVLGNPGVLVGDIQREATARHEVEPAVFHSGYSPALICGASAETLRLYHRSWPGALALPERTDCRECYTTPAGRYTVYYPSRLLPRSPVGNSRPVIIWEQPGGLRIVYVGDAAASTLECVPEHERRADRVILGFNPADPINAADHLSSFGAAEILLLPSAAHLPTDTWRLPGTKITRHF